MNKVYCRMYQGVMKVGMYFLPWSMPSTLEGPGTVKQLPSWIKEKGYRNVLIVTDKNLMKLHLLDSLLENLEKENVGYVMFDDVSPNPTDVDIETGVFLYRENRCDAMIAFGGGSPMDCAKGIGVRIARPRKTVRQLQGLLKVLKKIPVIFTVPTTAGTGSETTIAAVVTDSVTHHKASINDIRLIPKYAVLDPELTLGLPPHVTATTGMDALCHAVEAYTNHTYNTKLEDDLAKKAVKLIYDNLYHVYLHGDDVQARENMQRAALYAGRAFTRGCVGYVHAIGHTLGGLYGTPHGLAMGILLPHVLRRYGAAAYDKLADLCDVCGMPARNESKQAKAEAFISWIEDMKVKMDLPLYPPIIKDEDIDQMVIWADKEGNPLYPTPVTWSKAEFRDFIISLKDKSQEKAQA
ncbi:MAG: iron-containing alcohol dehydrogenase [Erysipelotrichaceae bacterium]|nr:iron-containing alcohol dehydrogenase [Erysipelotrichaceae bacterium]